MQTVLTMGEKIGDLLSSKGINAQKLSEDTGIPKATISEIIADKNKNFGYKTIVKIAKALKVSVDYLVGLEPEPTNNKGEQFICEYTGLSLEAIKTLHEGYYISTDILNSPIYNLRYKDYIGIEKYIEYTDKIRSAIISSNCFKELVSTATICKIISETVDFICNTEKSEIENFDIQQLDVFESFFNKYEREHKYQLYNGQNSFNEFIMNFAPIDYNNRETIKKLKTQFDIVSMLKKNKEDNEKDFSND